MRLGQWHAQAPEVRLGAFILPPRLIARINRATPLTLDHDAGIHLPSPGSRINGNQIHVGTNPQDPQIGDLRIRYNAVMPADVSIISVQRGNSFMPYFAANGNRIELLEYGDRSAQQMFQAAQDHDSLLTWFIRVVGFLLAFIGSWMMRGILPVLVTVLPALGILVDTAIGLIAFKLAAAITLVTIAIAWIFDRPMIAVGLLLVIALEAAGLIRAKSARRGRAIP
jgi:hypothetical protein